MAMLSEGDARLRDIRMPAYYRRYQHDILASVQNYYEHALKARRKGIDVADVVEPKIAFDLSDRVAKMHNIEIAERLRALLGQTTKEKAALKIAEEIAKGEYGTGDLRTRLDNAVRVSLAVVTEGVTVAPLQGISDVTIKNNADGSQYLSVSFAGPIRSAGGTEAALTMLIADHARKVAGLGTYKANSFDDETGRFVEELRIYEREVMGFQFKVLDEDVIKCIASLPVELDGVDTDPVDVVGHKGMRRIATDRVRGGALRVMNDGLIGRSRKLLKLVDTLKLDGWQWLKELKGAIQTGDDDAAHHRMSEVITGRPVLSMVKKVGGFRLRYGRSPNTGFATVGIHPAVPALLNYAIVAGTQIKMDIPGKASTIALVDTVEPPVVRMDDGRVLAVRSVEQAEKIRSKVQKILYLGDMLISYGDFLENNAQLPPASYVEEIWALQLRAKLTATSSLSIDNNGSDDVAIGRDRLVQLVEHPLEMLPTVDEAFEVSRKFGIPLHPRYSFYFDVLTIPELLYLKERLQELPNDPELKAILEKLGVSHHYFVSSNGNNINNNNDNGNEKSMTKKKIVLDDPDQAKSLSLLLQQQSPSGSIATDAKDAIEFVSKSSGITVMPKFASSIAVRVGRPEKAAERKMKPPVHVLFPIGTKGGATRDIIKACAEESLFTEIANRYCESCRLPSLGTHCRTCGASTMLRSQCVACKGEVEEGEKCPRCNRDGRTYASMNFPLKAALQMAEKKLGVRAQQPLKGVKSMMSRDKAAEPLEKGILRQKHELHAFKDGTIRFDATNEPLTHFVPAWIGVSVDKLKELGYSRDYLGHDLVSPDQLVELMMQDVIIPRDSAKHLVNAARFIDEELEKLYEQEPFYHVDAVSDLVGHLVVGLAPHTSVGIMGRIIGFTDSQVCLGSPIWHSAKRRDCDGDADSIMLLMDAFLNFSFDFLPDKIGGLMDAPLLIQPVVLPHEVQRQAHNVDIASSYPLEFYEATWKQAKAADVASMIETVKGRIGEETQFFGYGFTHPTAALTTKEQRSAYSTLNTMDEKLKMQFDTAKLISAVDADEVAAMVLTTHILPDIMGNMRSYSSQTFRCTNCGEKFRRMPLVGKCTECGNGLTQTVTRGAVEKYLGIATGFCQEYKINEYLKSRVESISAELKLIFREEKKMQSSLTEFMA
ncbi:MAG TPA: DNA polymerase II large subunit [Nitrososphaera sp.]|nr:DNA polymerase II large subunit [Nitrososphaera sp.]